ncbi:LEA type 2 family protein [Geomesophilobacter sediminis]|uniref:LEA type 2 family protein n=1 Tax=Geomesophilobacter sediminis TaxID=2798584 RepID=A0A8J7M1F2_9BACT|nr:LEA type 2 family protein [Geomesophilobacter sediminis]MBJ6726930.1 LEA type 2 family protein [Geomesophilobacter sediminis]
MRNYLFLLLVVVTLLPGCTSFVKQPVVTVKDVKMVGVDAGGAQMELNLVVENENGYNIRLLGYSYDLEVSGIPLTKGGARDEVTFAPKEATEFNIPVRIAYGDLISLLQRDPDPDHVPYRLRAGLDLDTPVGHMTVPIDRKGTYRIPRQYRPSYYLGKMKDILGLGQ